MENQIKALRLERLLEGDHFRSVNEARVESYKHLLGIWPKKTNTTFKKILGIIPIKKSIESYVPLTESQIKDMLVQRGLVAENVDPDIALRELISNEVSLLPSYSAQAYEDRVAFQEMINRDSVKSYIPIINTYCWDL